MRRPRVEPAASSDLDASRRPPWQTALEGSQGALPFPIERVVLQRPGSIPSGGFIGCRDAVPEQ
jgi:hypothetical protein